MCPPENRNVTNNVTNHVDETGRAHRPSPTGDAIARRKRKKEIRVNPWR